MPVMPIVVTVALGVTWPGGTVSIDGPLAGGVTGGVYPYTVMLAVALLPDESSAQYIFQGIVLIAIDFAIAMGFAQGIYKGLNAIPTILGGGGPFWND